MKIFAGELMWRNAAFKTERSFFINIFFRFKNFGANEEEAVAHAHLPFPSKDDNKSVAENVYTGPSESVYNLNLGVYHENEMAGRATLSPALNRRPDFKKKRQSQNSKVFRQSFLGKLTEIRS